MGSGVRIGIAGLGGMGSNVAVMLVRSGFRDLVVADFDTVDESNIARQAYLPRHLGMSKTDALVSVLHDIDPEASVEVHDTRLDTSNAAGIFSACDVVCEALAPDSLEQREGRIAPRATYLIPLQKTGKKWRVRMEGPLRNAE